MDEQVLKTVKPYEGLEVKLVDTGSNYQIIVNGQIKDVRNDLDRACESFDSFIH